MADYPIHVIDIRRFKDSEKLETDARMLFGILKRDGNMDELKAYREENEEEFENMSDDTYETIALLTRTAEFLEIKDSSKNEGGEINMCEAIRN